jgi:hypothetical protein
MIPAYDSKSNTTRLFLANDYICCEVLELSEQYPHINLGLQSFHERYDKGPKLGLITSHQMPEFYK